LWQLSAKLFLRQDLNWGLVLFVIGLLVFIDQNEAKAKKAK
jgi:hypothetical protein